MQVPILRRQQGEWVSEGEGCPAVQVRCGRHWPVADFAVGVVHEEHVRLGDHEAKLLESVLFGCGCRVGVDKEFSHFVSLPADTRSGDYA